MPDTARQPFEDRPDRPFTGDDTEPAWTRDAHDRIIDRLESARGPVIAKASEYPDGYVVRPHRHSRAQLIYALAVS